MVNSARQAAFSALVRVEENASYSNITLDSILSDSSLSQRDKSFASELFYGVIEKKLLLDYNIAVNADRPLSKIDTRIAVILRMGIYQLFFMESVPASAAVNESVKLCSSEPRLPDSKKGKNKYYSVKYSCPEEIIKLWRKSYGDENTIGILDSLEGRPPLCVRVNTLKTNAAELKASLERSGVSAEYSDKLDDCLILGNTGAIEKLEQYEKGYFHVQDEASQLCCRLLAPEENDILLDVCSAPGGKSFTLAQLMKNKGKIISCDIYSSRLRLVESGAKRLSADIISTVEADASELDMDIKADRVLCDVPCSGLGIIRRKPELRYKTDLGLDSLPDIQYKILCSSAEHLKAGGVLVYSTCTLNPAENGENIRRFLREHEDFVPYKIKLPEGITRGMDEPENELTLFPHITGTDGFFIAAVQRPVNRSD